MRFKHTERVKEQNGIVRLLFVVVPIIIAFIIISFFGVNRWYNDNLKPVDPGNDTTQTFIIEPGSSVRSIASDLQETGLIRNATAFSWYVGRSDEWQDLQAGTYTISPSDSVQDIVKRLATGDVDTNLVTIFPGRRLDEVQDDLREIGFSQQDINTALSTNYDASILADLPRNATLEGYLFPETYQITAGDTLVDVFSFALNEFSKLATPQAIDALAERGLNLHEAVILASIVANEVPTPEEQRQVAGVFYNRLEEGMPLGADATFFYAAAVSGEEPSPDLDHPYNTRIYGGLPPGPISNFNASAFLAVVNPTESDFLYFVSGDDGNTYFAKTFEEHEKNIELHCDELCQLP